MTTAGHAELVHLRVNKMLNFIALQHPAEMPQDFILFLFFLFWCISIQEVYFANITYSRAFSNCAYDYAMYITEKYGGPESFKIVVLFF